MAKKEGKKSKPATASVPAQATPSIDSNKHDSLNKKKGAFKVTEGKHVDGRKQPDTVHYDQPVEEHPEHVGPRGANAPQESLSDEKRREQEIARDLKLRKGMSSTDAVDSTGQSKHAHRVTPQGHDKHGARIPDKVHYDEKPIEKTPEHVGPRGQHAPQDTHHGDRPAKLEPSRMTKW